MILGMNTINFFKHVSLRHLFDVQILAMISSVYDRYYYYYYYYYYFVVVIIVVVVIHSHHHANTFVSIHIARHIRWNYTIASEDERTEYFAKKKTEELAKSEKKKADEVAKAEKKKTLELAKAEKRKTKELAKAEKNKTTGKRARSKKLQEELDQTPPIFGSSGGNNEPSCDITVNKKMKANSISESSLNAANISDIDSEYSMTCFWLLGRINSYEGVKSDQYACRMLQLRHHIPSHHWCGEFLCAFACLF
jgi:hypothetical protein